MKDESKKSGKKDSAKARKAAKSSDGADAASSEGMAGTLEPLGVSSKGGRSDQPNARGLRVAMVVSSYHRKITSALEAGAREVFKNAGGAEADLIVVSAPGSFELPVLAAAFARRPDIAAVIALGCVIRGETRHDRYINDAVTSALAQLSVQTGTPIGYGLLTVDTPKQARARAGGAQGNKGADAMTAALIAARTLEQVAT